MPKLLKKLSKKRFGIASARKSRHAKQRSPSPLPSPIPKSNHSISAPTTPPDSTFPTPYQTPDPEITFGGPEMMYQWPTDIEDLPKFHCELNFIEYFWGDVKYYLCKHCNYTFAELQENLPKALASVDISTIWKWEHRMIRWMEAYRGGHDAKEAQLLVKWFSSCRYTSHHVSTEAMGHRLD